LGKRVIRIEKGKIVEGSSLVKTTADKEGKKASDKHQDKKEEKEQKEEITAAEEVLSVEAEKEKTE
jgi:hypothetical protein